MLDKFHGRIILLAITSLPRTNLYFVEIDIAIFRFGFCGKKRRKYTGYYQ